MDLRHLRYFIAVAEELHFGKAAKRLNISQPPLSQQIKQLERHLDITLFHRTNRKVELTEAGQTLYKSATKLIDDFKLAFEYTQNVAKGLVGELTLGFSGSVELRILPEIIKACRKYCPGITLQLIQLTTAEQIKALEDRSIDLGLLVPPVSRQLISVEKIRSEDFLICLPENHHLAKMNKINIVDLKSENFIMTPKKSGIGYYDSINSIFEEAGFVPTVTQTANEQLTMVSLVAAGLGVVIVPNSTQSIKMDGIVYRELIKSSKKTTSIAWNKENDRPVIHEFLKLIREQIIPKYK